VIVDIIKIFIELAPVLIPFIPMYILSRKISSKTSFKPKNSALIAGWAAMLFESICFRVAVSYLSGSEELFIGVVSVGNSVFIAAMILIYISLKDMENILFPGARKSVLLKVILALAAAFIPLYLLLFHLSIGIYYFLFVILWPTGIFILSIDCFEVVDIFRKLGIDGWFYGLVGAIMLFAISFFSLYDALVPIVRLQPLPISIATNYTYRGEYIALIGSFLFLIPGIELHRKAELPAHGEGEENTAIREFLNNLGGIVGGSAAISILEGAVSGFKERRKEEISLQKDLTVKFDGSWEDFFEFLLATAYQCVGPIAFECSKNIGALERARAKVMEVFG